MDKITVLLVFLMNVNSTVSRNINLSRRTNLIEQIRPINNTQTAHMNTAPRDNNKDSTETSINMDSTTKMNDEQYEDTIDIVRSLDHYQNVYDDVTMRIMPARQGVEITTISSTSYRTTSEDSLTYLLKQHLPYAHPAPDQIGDGSMEIMKPATEPLWKFEDYNDELSVSQQLKKDYATCEAQKIRCLGDTEYNQPVCVWDLTIPENVNKNYRMKGFQSFCEVEYRNCLKRYELTGKSYADHYSEDYLEFLHYGWCEQCKVIVDCV